MFLVISVGFISCKTTQPQLDKGLTVNESQTDDAIAFEVVNNTTQVVEFPNTKQFFIEKKEGDDWVSIPVYPCPCGVPCGNPPVPTKVEKGGSITIKWDYISRKCRGREATEYKIDTGVYKFSLSYKLIEDGMIVETGTLEEEFELGD